jgi:membrane-bound ClpP family serine protease
VVVVTGASAGEARARSVLLRYLLWQVPAWVLAGVVLTAVAFGFGLSWWIVAAGIAVLVARDLALYPAMRATFRPPAPTHPVGARGVTVEPLHPEGIVRVQGELWRARTVAGAIPEQHEVIVTDARGLTLLVKPPDDG